jgi:hypothetical protein
MSLADLEMRILIALLITSQMSYLSEGNLKFYANFCLEHSWECLHTAAFNTRKTF